ncbi:MAG: cyanophycinase, partial [Gloeomargaritaceae cyanobacterium C42_A2020_066]|nr:cyanophycinase [Gloeomargaritaceae cyanobacterium C42_A2020_066]
MMQSAVLAIGGAEDKVNGREILRLFCERAGGTDATLGIIPAASGEPAIIGAIYQRLFEDLGAKRVDILDIREREQSENPHWADQLPHYSGIFMTGGDQLRLTTLLADTPLLEALLDQAGRGQITIAGTSAGAAVMSYHMIAGGGNGESPNPALVSMSYGFGFVPGVIVDQHFNNRNRMARLISALAMHPQCLGVGIDEDTCAVFEPDGQLQVVGRGTVVILDPGEHPPACPWPAEGTTPISLHNLRLHILRRGDRYNLRQRTTLPAA